MVGHFIYGALRAAQREVGIEPPARFHQDAGQGRALHIACTIPWPDEVSGARGTDEGMSEE